MHYLVTGAAGFIGFHTCRRLLADGHRVTGLDNLSDYYPVDLKQARLEMLECDDTFSFRRVDISDTHEVKTLFEETRPDIVVHLAAQAGVRYSVKNPFEYLNSNLAGFLSVIEACRAIRPKHFLFASTSSVYGANTQTPHKEVHRTDHPLSLYAATKKSNEAIAHAYAHLYGIPCSGLRFFTAYGPWGRPDMAYYKFTEAIIRGTPIDLYNDGCMFRDFTYIDDIVDGVTKLAVIPAHCNRIWDSEHPASGTSGVAAFEAYNIGNRQAISLLDFIDVLENIIDKKAVRNTMPMQPGDVHMTSADTSKLESVTGFKPNTDLRAGLSRFVDWYRDYHGV
ncbi:MAG: GDP-mannose 4,6-dehydratase [Hyphomonadaceae bacterium]|nr:GDP-mannose 4,6-dehydratase [Hyphomonadaceae bacterium]MBC6412861.1 GDP-mannose 4,6-dehydratase [Hyphomonadaceae bacterium]